METRPNIWKSADIVQPPLEVLKKKFGSNRPFCQILQSDFLISFGSSLRVNHLIIVTNLTRGIL